MSKIILRIVLKVKTSLIREKILAQCKKMHKLALCHQPEFQTPRNKRDVNMNLKTTCHPITKYTASHPWD